MSTSPAGKACVYLVDDDDDLRQALVYVLEKAGYQVLAFASPTQFQKVALQLGDGALLLDMRMPELSGLELQAWLKEKGCRIPVIFISGESLPFEIIEALKQEAIDFLLKPFAMARLFEAVEKALAVGAQQRALELRALRVQQLWSGLTPREREVCHLMTRGFANREIAEVHGSLPATVKLHRSRVLEKMAVESLPALVELLDGFDLSAWLLQESSSKKPEAIRSAKD